MNATLEQRPELKRMLESTPKQQYAVKEIIRKKVKVGPHLVTLSATMNAGRVSEISYNFTGLSPAQETMMGAVVNLVNLGLQNGVLPAAIAEKSLNVKGHPLISELKTFLQEFEEEGVAAEIEIPEARTLTKEESEKESCRSCGASQLRRNGTCMLCEVCGETSGCS